MTASMLLGSTYCFNKIPSSFIIPAHPGRPGNNDVNGVACMVCVIEAGNICGHYKLRPLISQLVTLSIMLCGSTETWYDIVVVFTQSFATLSLC